MITYVARTLTHYDDAMLQATSPYLSGVPGVGSTYAQYYGPQLVPAMLSHDPAAAAAAASPLGVVQQPVLQQKLPRTDRLEVRTRSDYLGSFGLPMLFPSRVPTLIPFHM